MKDQSTSLFDIYEHPFSDSQAMSLHGGKGHGSSLEPLLREHCYSLDMV
jgi:hypothetical protein